MKNILDNVIIQWTITLLLDNQEDLFTEYHTRFDCTINRNGKEYKFPYHCNLAYTQPTKESLLACLINDAEAYETNKTEDEAESVQYFADCFGYEKIGECLKAWKACKETSEAMKALFTDEEREEIRKELEEQGEM